MEVVRRKIPVIIGMCLNVHNSTFQRNASTETRVLTNTQQNLVMKWKQARSLGDHEQEVETDLPEWLQPFTEGVTRGSSS